MKKLIILAFLISGSATAQMDESRLIMGTKGAYGHSFIYPYNNCVYHSSWAIGLSTMYLFKTNMGLGIDALYSSEGATFKSGDLKAETKLDYLRLPVRFYYTLGKDESNFRPRIAAGPALGFLMDGSATGHEKMDFGINAGLGFQYRLSTGFWLTMDADYYHGLMDVYKANTESDNNANIRLNIGVMVGL
jgi:hypothetical protein